MGAKIEVKTATDFFFKNGSETVFHEKPCRVKLDIRGVYTSDNNSWKMHIRLFDGDTEHKHGGKTYVEVYSLSNTQNASPIPCSTFGSTDWNK